MGQLVLGTIDPGRFVELHDAGRVVSTGVAAQRARRGLADDDGTIARDVVAEEGVDGIERRLGVGLRRVQPVVRLRPGLQHDLALGRADERGRGEVLVQRALDAGEVLATAPRSGWTSRPLGVGSMTVPDWVSLKRSLPTISTRTRPTSVSWPTMQK